MVAIQGKLEEASLPDVLQLLALGKKSGCLSLTDQSLQGHIYLDAGRITYAAVANRRDRLGDMLVRGGRITREQLAQAVERQSSDQAKNLGQILVESGQIERAELERFSHVQIEEAVYFLFTWRKGTFTFESSVQPPTPDFLVSINPEGLLLEGARRVDEWSLIEKKIPSFDMIFKLDKTRLAGSDVTLTPEQRRLLPFLDGSHDVTGLVEATAMAEFDVGKALYGLVSAGFAPLLDRRASIRHLDYRELLAYLVHEAEFADPERRKEASRHIVDCQLCAPRLKEIHVRRTRETGAAQLPAVPDAPVAAPASATPLVVAPSSPAPPAPPPPPQRRSGDRRQARPRETISAADRRYTERRQGERRRVALAALPAGRPDRRAGAERRRNERRLKDRLGLALARATSGGAGAQSGGRPRRNTGPRRLTTVSDRTGTHSPSRSRPPAKPAPAAPPAAAAPTAATTTPTPVAKDAESARPVSPPAPPAPAGPGRARARSKEIEWLITPEESGVHPVAKLPPPIPAPPPAPRRPAEAPTTAARPVGSQAPAATGSPTLDAAEAATVPQIRVVQAIAPAADAAARPALSPLATPSRRWLAIAATAVAFAGIGGAASLMLRPRVSNGTDSRPTSPTVAVGGQAGGIAAVESAEQAPPTAGAETPPTVNRAPGREPEPPPARTPRSVERPAVVAPPVAMVTPDSQAARPPAVTPVRAEPVQERRVVAAPAVTPAAPQPAAVPDPVPAPAAAGLTGFVRHAGTGAAIAGARLRIAGTALTATTAADGRYAFADPPAGLTSVVAAAEGYAPQGGDVAVEAGVPVSLDLVMLPPPPASKPDEELVPARWERIAAEDAEKLLGQPVAVIAGLWVESIAKPPGATRPRVRVAQLTPSGERVSLVETRSGAAVRADRPRLTALRLMPPSEVYPVTTGTGSFGNLLVTATTVLPPDSVRALLGRLIELPR
ncbi:MAG TPA: DUF4388 domain-containing protein [Gemmatimonadales bacterium]